MGERGRELLELLNRLQRLANTVAAMQVRVLAKFATVDRDELDPTGEFTHLEVAAVLRSSHPFARARLEFAQALTSRLPATLQALQDGTIDEYRARRMVEVTEVLTDAQAAQVEEQLIPQAEDWTPQQLNSRLRRAVIRVDPEAAAARAEARRAARHVRHDVLDDGAGLLQIHGDVERTSVAYQRVQTIARELKRAGDARTMDQITADVALDVLAGKNFQHAKVHVWLTLPATTALGVDEQPGYLAGYGYLPAQRALELAAQQGRDLATSTHRPGQRARPGRRPPQIPSTSSTPGPPTLAVSHLHRPWLSPTSTPLRPRPPRTLPSRANQPRQRASIVSPAPPRQNTRRLASNQQQQSQRNRTGLDHQTRLPVPLRTGTHHRPRPALNASRVNPATGDL